MRTVMHIGSIAVAAVFALALAIDAADARRGGGGGMRAGGMGGGRVGMAGGAGRAHVSRPIARPGGGIGPGGGGNWANRPGGGGNWAGRPGWNNPGYRPGYGWGAAAAAGAIGAGIAYGSSYGSGYGGYYEEPAYSSYYAEPSYSYQQVAAEPGSDGDLIAECARRFKTYDMASQTYVRSKGVRASCP